MYDTTFVLTSCRRPDLLSQTIESLRKIDLSGLKEFIIIEDSDNADIAKIIPEKIGNVPVNFLQNHQNIGQLASVDRAYANVRTPYIYHCEDDWIFPSSLFLEGSRIILEECSDVTAVMVRDPATISIHRFKARLEETKAIPKTRYWRYKRWFKDWGYFSFNPGLRRKSDYDKFGPYAPYGDEKVISQKLGKRGRRLAYLLKGDVYHIGWEHSMREQVLAEKKAAQAVDR